MTAPTWPKLVDFCLRSEYGERQKKPQYSEDEQKDHSDHVQDAEFHNFAS
jgi:hypothetical protein